MVTAVSAGDSGPQEGEETGACTSCGKCEIAASEARCGCCRGAEPSAAPPACGESSRDESRHTEGVAGSRSDGQDAHSQGRRVVALGKTQTLASVGGLCLCTVQSHPASPTAPPSPVRAGGDPEPWMLVSSLPPLRPSEPSLKRRCEMFRWDHTGPIDSQAELCVWRL